MHGVNNEELAVRGIGMGAAMAHTVKSIAYQFKNNSPTNTNNTVSNIINRAKKVSNVATTPMQTTEMKTTSLNTTNLNNKNVNENNVKQNNTGIKDGISKAYNVGKDVMKLGRYMADGQPVNNNSQSFNKFEKKNSNMDLIKNDKSNHNNVFNKIKEDDENG